jgi:outer membrane protein TolC
MRAPVVLLPLLAVAALPAVAQAPAPSPAPPVEELVAMALERSPAVAARRAEMAAAREMERPARALPDPMVEAMLQNADFPEFTVGEEEMSMVGIEVRQPLPYPGKLRARGEAAAAETAMRAAEVAETESRVAAEVRSLYARIYAMDRERQALTTSHELVELLSATAQARYASGGAEQESIIRAQLEGSRLGEELDDLEAERAAMVAELNRWLDRPGDTPLGEVVELPAVTAPAAGWQEAAVQASPAVQVARAAVAAAERRLAVSRLDLKPDFSPSAGIATQGSMGNVVTLRFGVELPFRKAQRQEPMIRAAEHELEAARRMQADAEAMARAEAARIEARWRQADRQIVRIREAILPQTSVGLDAARASYLAGRGDFSTVVENFRMWIESRVQLARREADRFAAWAETERFIEGGQR